MLCQKVINVIGLLCSAYWKCLNYCELSYARLLHHLVYEGTHRAGYNKVIRWCCIHSFIYAQMFSWLTFLNLSGSFISMATKTLSHTTGLLSHVFPDFQKTWPDPWLRGGDYWDLNSSEILSRCTYGTNLTLMHSQT